MHMVNSIIEIDENECKKFSLHYYLLDTII